MKFDLVLGAPPKAVFLEVKAFAAHSLSKGSLAVLVDDLGRVHHCTRLSKSKSISKIVRPAK